MAQVVPSLTSLPVDSTAAPSVEDIQARLPSICVDYLSHEWSEEDVWASWRSMTRHKNEIANGVRLENASWRTWWKQRCSLKTISPETMNWLKDSDVTWLYGPLHTAVEPVPPSKLATIEDRLGIDRNKEGVPSTKSILRQRTLSDMLSIPKASTPILNAVNAMQVDDESINGDRPIMLQTKSDTNVVTKGLHQRTQSPTREPILQATQRSGTETPADGTSTPIESILEPPHVVKKHISFNTFVEQCIAVDDPSDILAIEEQAIDRQSAVEDEEGADRISEMRSRNPSPSPSRSNSSQGHGRTSFSSSSSASMTDRQTIAMLAPTSLKVVGDFPSPSPEMVYVPTYDYEAEPCQPLQNSIAHQTEDVPRGRNITHRQNGLGGSVQAVAA